jgi:hypothetical protein
VHAPCHHEHLTHSERQKKSQAASGALSAAHESTETQDSIASPSNSRSGKEYILQRSPQRVGVTSIGIRIVPAVSGQRSQGALSLAAPMASLQKQKTKDSHLNATALKPHKQTPLLAQSKENAEATAWLSIARDDAQALASVLPHLSINLADEDGETLLLCACR